MIGWSRVEQIGELSNDQVELILVPNDVELNSGQVELICTK